MSTLLEDLPEDAFPGEENAQVLLEMIVGTVMPAVASTGLEASRQATALVVAIRERVFADLRTAVRIAAGGEASGEGEADR